ncbi:hypothetical protein D3C76_26140 [compost metagenome]
MTTAPKSKLSHLTMKKGDYTFRFIDPRIRRKLRNQYQNLSLAMKLKWRADIRKMKDSLKKSGLAREDGSIDVFALSKRAQLHRTRTH